MASIHEFSFGFSKTPKVFTPMTQARLETAGRITRQLRGLGCRVVSLDLGGPGELIEIVVDRNPHVVLHGCGNVHVTCRGGK